MSLQSVVQKETWPTRSEAVKMRSVGLELQIFVPVHFQCVATALVTEAFQGDCVVLLTKKNKRNVEKLAPSLHIYSQCTLVFFYSILFHPMFVVNVTLLLRSPAEKKRLLSLLVPIFSCTLCFSKEKEENKVSK